MPRRKRNSQAIDPESPSHAEGSVARVASPDAAPLPDRPRKRNKTSGNAPSRATRSRHVQELPAPEDLAGQGEDWTFLKDIKEARYEAKPPSEEALDGSQGEPSELLSHSQMARIGDARTWYGGKWYIGGKEHTKAVKVQNIRDAFKMPARECG
ncbi:hypothetical protein CLAFUW4_05255 [Fulvia fulva]|uniref:Uncharacterized protein n=1 Tax=Passalora fulva TaxID=5499 RepID=A0A9Q8LIX7_PASFU|nr:uncharacterized protein CLAFUR5_05402 [Fulvia fulva]KAK4623811.1 hypothetical protein CLAFUR4_05249 [Fulvia fulva]KAK4625410.1 hypothetical protein CLAFUR0_05255 [Fulvia fulva]UJO18335.1 hypothetical protein CLAFUR5_05402 [Fulvia fulva]WPV15115.1 hypothetical protein CLAFUW4_05255 [Fulvia fulva]WPV29967.1 hypothetical protein CLAFUW7_05254 [Fulvia fulva]